MQDQKTNQNEQHWRLLVLLLKMIAIKKGISQEQIANETGLQRQNVNRVFSLRYCPRLDIFLNISKAVGVNFFVEDKEGTTELTELFEQAMTELGRRPEHLQKN